MTEAEAREKLREFVGSRTGEDGKTKPDWLGQTLRPADARDDPVYRRNPAGGRCARLPDRNEVPFPEHHRSQSLVTLACP